MKLSPIDDVDEVDDDDNEFGEAQNIQFRKDPRS